MKFVLTLVIIYKKKILVMLKGDMGFSQVELVRAFKINCKRVRVTGDFPDGPAVW